MHLFAKFSTRFVASQRQMKRIQSRSLTSKVQCVSAAGWRNRRFQELRAPSDSDAIVRGRRNSRYAKLNGDDFYRGIADAGEDGTALFASTGQLNILKIAKEVCFDVTFKVLTAIYYQQLLTVFALSGDAAFPVRYLLMTRKTQAMYRKTFLYRDNLPTNYTCPPFSGPVSAVLYFQVLHFQSTSMTIFMSFCSKLIGVYL